MSEQADITMASWFSPEPADDVVWGMTGGNLIFGHAGTDYLVMGRDGGPTQDEWAAQDNHFAAVIAGDGSGLDLFDFGSGDDPVATLDSLQVGDRLWLEGEDAHVLLASEPAQLTITHELRADGEYTIVSGTAAHEPAGGHDTIFGHDDTDFIF